MGNGSAGKEVSRGLSRAPSSLPQLLPAQGATPPAMPHPLPLPSPGSYPDPVVLDPTRVPFKKPSPLFSPVKSQRPLPLGVPNARPDSVAADARMGRGSGNGGAAPVAPASPKLGTDPLRPLVWKASGSGPLRAPGGADVVTGDIRFLMGVHKG